MSKFVVSTFVLSCALVLGAAAQQRPAVTVRKNASLPAAQADLEALGEAMKIMKGLKCSDPTSWYYQGAIHWVPDDALDKSNLGKGNPFCPEYTGKKEQLKPAWDNCTHSEGTLLHFLIWHRLYIYYVEEIVKAKTGKADFALPYWDYTNPDPKFRVMPAALRDPQSGLYEKARYTPLNEGSPIGEVMDSALDVTKLMQYESYELFNENMDKAPHGAMHDYLGYGYDESFKIFNEIYQTENVGLMANVGSAAFDPVFWIHHSNIDYLWQTWMSKYSGPFPDLAELEQSAAKVGFSYNFFDPNGNPVSLSVEEAYVKAFSLPVTYDVFQATGLVAVNPKSEEPIGRALTGSRTTISMSMESAMAESAPAKVSKAKRTILHLEVSFAAQPKGIFEVFVRNSKDKELDSKEQLAGVMTFFGASHHAAHHPKSAMADMAPGGAAMKRITQTFRFDVTDEIDPDKADGKLEIHIKKHGDTKAASGIKVESVSLHR